MCNLYVGKIKSSIWATDRKGKSVEQIADESEKTLKIITEIIKQLAVDTK